MICFFTKQTVIRHESNRIMYTKICKEFKESFMFSLHYGVTRLTVYFR